MKCHKCGEVGIVNHAMGKEFWYCRTCKIEIEDNTPPAPSKDPNGVSWWGPELRPGDEMVDALRHLYGPDLFRVPNDATKVQAEYEQLEFDFNSDPAMQRLKQANKLIDAGLITPEQADALLND